MKRALVIGGARSGKYIALLLNREGYNVVLTDFNEVDYKNELEEQGIKVVDQGHPDSLLDQRYDLVIKNPGIKYTADFIQKVIKQGYRIYNEIEVSLRFTEGVTVFAVSGTNGKTTTVTLLFEMIQKDFEHAYLAGNIGNAVSETIYKHPDLKILVVEMSSFQLDGTFDFHPQYAALTNLQEDHLDYYDSIEDYYASKQRLYQNQADQDSFFINVDDPVLLAHLNKMEANRIFYGLDHVSDIVHEDDKVYYKEDLLFDIKKMTLVGKHNLYNALLASLMAYEAGVSTKSIQDTLYHFKGVEHRIEFVTEIDDVKYYNDSKGTNVESVIVALDSFDDPTILIAGGYDKNISFEALKDHSQNVKLAILFGQTKEKLSKVFNNHILVNTLEEAVVEAKKQAVSKDVVLFSPACASFDQFKDYEQRGHCFKEAVNKL